MTNEKILGLFLKHNRDFTSFKRQTNKTRLANTSNYVSESIDSNFTWSSTNEGHNYWSDVNKKWKKLCKDMKLRGNIDLNRL